MGLLEGLRKRLPSEQLTPATLEKEFSGIEPIKAEKSTYEIWEKGLKLTSNILPPEAQKGEVKAWLVLQPKYTKGEQLISLVLEEIKPGQLIFSSPLIPEGSGQIYLEYPKTKFVISGIEFPSIMFRPKKPH